MRKFTPLRAETRTTRLGDYEIKQTNVPIPVRVYLAGPITGCTYGDCTDWRAYAAEKMPPWMHGVSPMRGKEYLQPEAAVADSYPEFVLSSDRGIMSRDSNDVKRADLVLANFVGATRVSIGTCIECAWAWLLGKPVVLCMEESGNPNDHSMLRETAGWRVTSLDEGLEIAYHILRTGV